jgi:hypothetical protein
LTGRHDETGAIVVNEEETFPAGEHEPNTAQLGPAGAGQQALDDSQESAEAAELLAPSSVTSDIDPDAQDESDSGTAEEPTGAEMPEEAGLLAEIVSLPPVRARRTMVQPVERARARVGRWLVYALLIVLVALPPLLDRPLLSRRVSVGPGALALHEAIESLDSRSVALVAFDYDPTASGEMDSVARVVVTHLMDQGARVIAVSFLPAGAATAQDLLAGLAQDREGYRDSYGQSYANLGFVPGQAAGVRLLAHSLEKAAPSDFYGTPLSQVDVAEGLFSAQSFDLVVELAATTDSVRWWVEQAGAPLGIPIGAGVSASAAPWAKTYFETEPKLLVGLLGGVSDAAMYDAYLQGRDHLSDPFSLRLDSQLAGHLLLICLILVGNGAYLLRRSVGRKG